MGRQLFSSLYKNDVRIVPIPTPDFSSSEHTSKHQVEEKKEEERTYRTWSVEHPFDPDSDEFFNGPDAVYEAFIEEEDGYQPPVPDFEEEEEVEQRGVVPSLLPIASIPIRDVNEEDDEEREIVEQTSPMAVGSMTDEHDSGLANGYAYILQHESNYVPPQHSSYASSRHQTTRSVDDSNRLVWTTDILPIPARPATPPSSSRSRNLLFSSTMNLWDGHLSSASVIPAPMVVSPMSHRNARVSMSHLRSMRDVVA